MAMTAAIDADDGGGPRRHEGAGGGDGHEAGEHAVDHHAGVRLAGPPRDVEHRHDGTDGTGDRRVGGDGGELDVGGGERRGGVEAEPAEQQDEAAEHRHRDVVAGDGPRLAVGAVLADAGAEHDRAGERGDAADCVHDAGTGEVDVAGAEAHGVPVLASQPPPQVHAANSG